MFSAFYVKVIRIFEFIRVGIRRSILEAIEVVIDNADLVLVVNQIVNPPKILGRLLGTIRWRTARVVAKKALCRVAD